MFNPFSVFSGEFHEFFVTEFFLTAPIVIAYLFFLSLMARKTHQKGKNITFFPGMLTAILFALGVLVVIAVIISSLYRGNCGEGCGMFFLFVPPVYIASLVVNFLVALLISFLTKKFNFTTKKYTIASIVFVAIYLAILIPYLSLYHEARPSDESTWIKKAIEQNNPKLCSRIKPALIDSNKNDWKETSCLADGGKNTGNIAFCQAIRLTTESRWFADECYTAVAYQNNQTQTCDYVSTEKKADCLLLVRGANYIKEKNCPDASLKTCLNESCPFYYPALDSDHLINCLTTQAQLQVDTTYCNFIPSERERLHHGFNTRYEDYNSITKISQKYLCLNSTKMYTAFSQVYDCKTLPPFLCLNNACNKYVDTFSAELNSTNLKNPQQLGELRECFDQTATEIQRPDLCTKLDTKENIYRCLERYSNLVGLTNKERPLCEPIKGTLNYEPCFNMTR